MRRVVPSMSCFKRVLLLCLGWTAASSAACGKEFETAETDEPLCPGDGSVPCNQDPWNCSDNQTCWFSDETSGMTCLNAGPAAAGAACTPTIGTPTCGPGLLCVGDNAGGGTCRPFCDTMEPCKACPEGLVCQGVSFRDSTTNEVIASTRVCLPPP